MPTSTIHKPYGPYEKYFKRPLDVILSGAALVVLSPVIGVTALLVQNKLGSPVLFTQERPGKDEKIFKMYKFRSMTDERDAEGNLLPDDVRLTRFGRILRSTSMDELPELWNIFKGDMSIVGPRPLLVKYLPLYNEEQHHRHDVRPGLTGYAQVHGRNALTWEEKFHMDVWYVNNISLLLDVNVFLKTIKTVLKRDGISSESSATMEEFKGSMYSTRIKFGVVRTEENVFESFAPHDLATLNYFAGCPAENMTLHRGYFLQKDICDYVLAYLEYPNNIKAHIQVSWLHPFKEQRVVVVGSKGMIRFDDAGDKQVRLSRKTVDFSNVKIAGDLPRLVDGETEVVPVDYSQMPLERELRYFVEHLETPPEYSTGADGYALVKALAESRK